MTATETQLQITDYLQDLPENKRTEMLELQAMVKEILPDGPLWFLDGKDEKGKIVTNPNIGFGSYHMQYANGKTKAFYQIGLSANTTGISVYIMGIEDRKYLPTTYAKTIGKASVTGYCIKFKTLRDIQLEVLKSAIKDGIEKTK